MTTARKTILVILTIILAVPAFSYLFAKFAHRTKSRIATEAVTASEKNVDENPLFYDSIGSSDPEPADSRQSERVVRYTVHVKTVGKRDEAESILKDLTKAGLSGYYTPVRQKDRVVYHVRLGVYPDEREALKTLATLQTKTKISGSVTKLQ